MNQRSMGVRGRLLSTTIAASAALLATPAFAQDEPATTTAEEVGEEESIVVTGTLVRNPNLVASAPVSVVGEDEIELQQANVAEELIRDIPGVSPSIGGNVNNGNGGASFVNLRGLGSQRNVVLLDGVRIVPAELLGRVDLNNIPLALIQRVDVLTGGASTTYGADAVTGVVNFITRRDFAGIDVNLSQQITEQGDGNVFRADVTIGANFDDGRGNAVLSLGYQEADPVYMGARDYGLAGLATATGGGGGSGTSAPTSFTGINPTGADQISVDCGAAGQPACNNVQGNRQTTPTGFQLTIPFNFNPYNVYQVPFERFNIYSAARYEIGSAIEIYTRGLFSKNTVQTIIAPSGSFGRGVVLPLSNPFLTATQRNAFCAFDTNPGPGYTPTYDQATCDAAATAVGPADPNYRTVSTLISRRAVEAGPRVSTYVTNVFDYRLGARGGITDSIDWDVFGSYGESQNVQTITGYLLNSRIDQSVLTTGLGAAATCQNPANGCIPVNWFGPTGSITPAMADYLTDSASVTTQVSLAQARATINGDFGWTIPWANEPVAFAVGGEFREYRAAQISDALAKAGDLAGSGGAAPDIDGGYNVYEAFGELIVPLVQDRPFFDELQLEAGIRYSSYNIDAPGQPSFTTTTWKVGGSWAPIDGLRFRGNYARAVRAPNIAELFAPVNTGLTSLADDPCANINDNGTQVAGRSAPTGELRAICLAQGAPAVTLGTIGQPTAGQANATGGGNIDLQPEEATTWTVGAVFQPDFVPGLSLSIDYYNIEITRAITFPAPGDVIASCFGTPTGTQYNPAAGASATAACLGIRRNPISGQLSGDPTITPGIPASLSNLGLLKTSGVDFSLNYNRDLGFAGLAFNANLNWQNENIFQAVEGVSLLRDCVGFYSPDCGQPIPEWTWNVRTTLSFDDIDLSLLWRHSAATEFEPPNVGFAGTLPASAGPLAGRTVDFNRIPAYDYFDFSARFAIDDHLTITLVVQNLLDKEPPLVGSESGAIAFNGGNTFPSTYDALGRRFVASARIRF